MVCGCGDTPTTPVKRETPGALEKPTEPEKPGGSDKPDPTQPAKATSVTPPRSATEFEQALARAKAEGKMVFVEFSAVWCGPCQQMKRDTFTHPQVRARLAEYVPLFVDTDQEPALARRFGVRGIPAYYVMRPDRVLVLAGSGYVGPSEFMRWLDGAK
jgi:thiol:disulfide interchange protein